MKHTKLARPTLRRRATCAAPRTWLTAFTLLLLLGLSFADARAQASKLPSPDKIVADHLKAVGGKKRLAALRDETCEWTVQGPLFGEARARTWVKSPSSGRTEVFTQKGSLVGAANARTVWRRNYDGPVETVTGSEAFTTKIQATLSATRMLDFKKLKILARTVGVEQVDGEQAYIVEFSTREGGRYRVWFSAGSKMQIKVEDVEGKTAIRYSDFRPDEGGVIVPHRAVQGSGDKMTATFTLQSTSYNTGLADSLFEPPSDSTLDIPALLRDISKNQDENDERVGDYTFTRKVTERELNDRGEVKKEKVTVYEVYPVVGSNWVWKLVSENGVPLTPEREAKEQKRVAEELEKSVRDVPRHKEKREREKARRAEQRKKSRAKSGGGEADEDDDDIEISTFLRACELFSPRREHFRDRDVIVFDFRPRAGFRPANQGETIVSKLSGVIWVDPAERQVMRLEARLVDDFKIGGGLVASIKPGSSFIFEQTRLENGVWLPRFSQVNASARIFLFKGMSVNEMHEFSDYKRFSARTGEDKLDAPKEKPPQ